MSIGNVFKISIRPYALYFLKTLSEYCDIYVFTSATKKYAKAAIAKLNTKGNTSQSFIKDFLSREDCFETAKEKFIKDLRIVQNRELKDMVIIDNLVESFGLHLNNGIPILDFDGKEKDNSLFTLIPFLKELSSVEDVRPVLKKKYNLEALGSLQHREVEIYLESLAS